MNINDTYKFTGKFLLQMWNDLSPFSLYLNVKLLNKEYKFKQKLLIMIFSLSPG